MNATVTSFPGSGTRSGRGGSRSAAPLVAIGLAFLVILATAGVHAQSPGESQKMTNVLSESADHEALGSIVGSFDVEVKSWQNPEAATVEGTLTGTNRWVLGGAFLETKLEGTVGGESTSEIGYLGFDACKEQWEAVRMSTDSAGMIWYRGEFDDSGTQITLRAEVRDPRTDVPSLREMRISIEEGGAHTVEVLVPGTGNMMFKTKESRYTKTDR